jgi:hypothetical protein
LFAALVALPGQGWTHEPTAGEWLADCKPYLEVLEGADGSDLDIMYCTGLTVGIVAGLGTGAQIGAVSMASTLTVLAGLDQARVLGVIQSLSRADLLSVCMPADRPISEILTVVAAHLDAHPERASLPVTAVFFEALQATYPCAPQDDAAAPGTEPAN